VPKVAQAKFSQGMCIIMLLTGSPSAGGFWAMGEIRAGLEEYF
jgi:hypothetical protein